TSYPPWSYNQPPWMYQAPCGAPPAYPPPSYHQQHPTVLGPHIQLQHGEANYVQHVSPAPTDSSCAYLHTALPAAFSTMSLQDPTDNAWHMDSGASNHIEAQAGPTNSEQNTPL
ncbi:hypothetical protein N665_0263s0003, partial [Sinapis alba]